MINQRTALYILIICAVMFYGLAGVLFNPFIIWTALPLYIAYFRLRAAIQLQSRLKYVGFLEFSLVSIGFSLFYHLPWFFDWWGTKTSSSTSALIFIFLPVYAVILGFVGLFIGWTIGMFRGLQ